MDNFGDIANVAQLTGFNAIALIGLIVKSAHSARLHKRNCRQFAQHLKLIGNLLEQLKITELRKYPETREPLEQLEDALRRAYILVHSCQEKSYLYLLAMGWSIVYQFKRAQEEIDRYLKIMPLVSLVSNARLKERLERIQRDQYNYTLDEDVCKVHVAVLNQEPSKPDIVVLKKTLSRSYPNMRFEEALHRESEKLKVELKRSQDIGQSEVIQRLIQVTETAVRNSGQLDKNYLNSHERKGNTVDESYSRNIDPVGPTRNSAVSPGKDFSYSKGSNDPEEWHTDLLDCCSEPKLCMQTCFFPCGTLSKIASVATNQHMSLVDVCHELGAYSLILACCCYTCCVRRKLRVMLDINGGLCDDFLSHLLCCCCSLVQEWREIEIRGIKGPVKTIMDPPPEQRMES